MLQPRNEVEGPAGMNAVRITTIPWHAGQLPLLAEIFSRGWAQPGNPATMEWLSIVGAA